MSTLQLRSVLIRRYALMLSDLNRPVTIEPPPAAAPAGDETEFKVESASAAGHRPAESADFMLDFV